MNVLYVCTGNVNRSALAELWHRKYEPSDTVSSAAVGARAVAGRPMGRTFRILADLDGIDTAAKRSQLATLDMLKAADRVIYMQPSHFSDLRRIIATDAIWAPPEGKYQSLASYIGAARIPDPAFGGPDVARTVYGQVRNAVQCFLGDDVWS